MKGYDQIKEDLRIKLSNDDSIYNTCENLVGYLSKKSPEELHFLTFSNFGEALNKSPFDQEVIRAILILESKEFGLLDRHFMFVDEQEQEHEFSVEDVSEAERLGGMPHPITGEIVRDYKKFLFPFFSVTSEIGN